MPTENPTMFDQVAEVIERLRPFLLRDGGDCTLVDVEDGIVKLQLHGAEEVPGVIEVEQVF